MALVESHLVHEYHDHGQSPFWMGQTARQVGAPRAIGDQLHQLAGRLWVDGLLLYLNRRSFGTDAEVRSMKTEG